MTIIFFLPPFLLEVGWGEVRGIVKLMEIHESEPSHLNDLVRISFKKYM